ncbi:uncharacterized protein [Miscanthus floridulus]|uniref:uncharacterized protein n=1 Tax=Miscanthus floridulus TaxID=154761 RepID=UPI00345926C6
MRSLVFAAAVSTNTTDAGSEIILIGVQGDVQRACREHEADSGESNPVVSTCKLPQIPTVYCSQNFVCPTIPRSYTLLLSDFISTIVADLREYSPCITSCRLGFKWICIIFLFAWKSRAYANRSNQQVGLQ